MGPTTANVTLRAAVLWRTSTWEVDDKGVDIANPVLRCVGVLDWSAGSLAGLAVVGDATILLLRLWRWCSGVVAVQSSSKASMLPETDESSTSAASVISATTLNSFGMSFRQASGPRRRLPALMISETVVSRRETKTEGDGRRAETRFCAN